MKRYENVEAYVRDHGFSMKDLTPGEVKEATEEMEALNAGCEILDGVFSPGGAVMRRRLCAMFPASEEGGA